MKMTLTRKVALPLLVPALMLVALGALTLRLNARTAAKVQEERALLELSALTVSIADRIKSGILTGNPSHAIAAAQAALDGERRLADLGEVGEGLRSLFQDHYAGLVAINAVFLENRLAEGERRLGQLEESSRRIAASIESRIEAAGVEREEIMSLGQTLLAVAGAVFLLSLAVVVWLLRRGVVAPVAELGDMLRIIADGEGDLTARLERRSNDEVGEIADSFNRMMASLQRLVRHVQESGLQIASAAEELSVTAGQTRQAVAQQLAEIEQVATAVNEMSSSALDVSRNAQSTSELTGEAAGGAESGRRLVMDEMEAIRQLADEIRTAADVIRRLDEDSRNIGSVLDVIRAIAEQTNLLALNAAIEAARAGEHGRGFSVVADEVRTLANRTQTSTQEIHQMIERLQSGARQAVAAMGHEQQEAVDNVQLAERVGTALQAIRDAIRRVDERTAQIASAAEQQSAVAHEIDEAVSRIHAGSQETMQATDNTAEASASLTRLAQELRQRVEHFRT